MIPRVHTDIRIAIQVRLALLASALAVIPTAWLLVFARDPSLRLFPALSVLALVVAALLGSVGLARLMKLPPQFLGAGSALLAPMIVLALALASRIAPPTNVAVCILAVLLASVAARSAWTSMQGRQLGAWRAVFVLALAVGMTVLPLIVMRWHSLNPVEALHVGLLNDDTLQHVATAEISRLFGVPSIAADGITRVIYHASTSIVLGWLGDYIGLRSIDALPLMAFILGPALIAYAVSSVAADTFVEGEVSKAPSAGVLFLASIVLIEIFRARLSFPLSSLFAHIFIVALAGLVLTLSRSYIARIDRRALLALSLLLLLLVWPIGYTKISTAGMVVVLSVGLAFLALLPTYAGPSQKWGTVASAAVISIATLALFWLVYRYAVIPDVGAEIYGRGLRVDPITAYLDRTRGSHFLFFVAPLVPFLVYAALRLYSSDGFAARRGQGLIGVLRAYPDVFVALAMVGAALAPVLLLSGLFGTRYFEELAIWQLLGPAIGLLCCRLQMAMTAQPGWFKSMRPAALVALLVGLYPLTTNVEHTMDYVWERFKYERGTWRPGPEREAAAQPMIRVYREIAKARETQGKALAVYPSPEARPFWDHFRDCLSSAMSVPALTGAPLIGGQPPLWCKRDKLDHGFSQYARRKDDTPLSDADLCARARGLGFTVVYRIDPAGEGVAGREISCRG
jgi:hypothetical protein